MKFTENAVKRSKVTTHRRNAVTDRVRGPEIAPRDEPTAKRERKHAGRDPIKRAFKKVNRESEWLHPDFKVHQCGQCSQRDPTETRGLSLSKTPALLPSIRYQKTVHEIRTPFPLYKSLPSTRFVVAAVFAKASIDPANVTSSQGMRTTQTCIV